MNFAFDLKGSNLLSYITYRKLITALLSEDKTTGGNHSAEMIAYTKLNETRMNRIEKTIYLDTSLTSQLKIASPQQWLVLCEAWCGDVAQNLPIIHKMAELTDRINLQILLRDENLHIMDAFLTKKGRAIPKLIAIDNEGEILFTWGRRPNPMQQLVQQLKKEGLEVFKVFSVGESFDFDALEPYKPHVNYFLLDTKGKERGGNGVAFDWSLLAQYDNEIPLILSGGLNPQNIQSALDIQTLNLFALDLNSGFELEPGLKDLELLRDNLKNQLKD